MCHQTNEFAFAAHNNPAIVTFFGWVANQDSGKEVEIVDRMEDIGERVEFIELVRDPENNDRDYMAFEGVDKYFLAPKNNRSYSVG